MNLRSPGMQVQLIGILVSIMGAVVAEFFKGPLVRPSSHDHLKHANKQYLVFSSTPEFWVLGGALLAAASFSVSISNFIQVYSFSFSILKKIKFSFWIFVMIQVFSSLLTLLERNSQAISRTNEAALLF